MVAFYKHDIPSWMDGTEGLSDGAYRAYHVICQLIYLHEGPVMLNERGIAGRCNQAVKSFRKHFQELLDAGKLTVSDGRIFNARAALELENVRKNRENAGKGGKTSADARKNLHEHEIDADNPLKNKDEGQAALQDDPSLKEKRREEKKLASTVEGGTSGSQIDTDYARLQAEIAQAFAEAGNAIPPHPGRARVWLANGFSPDLIISVIREGLARKPDISNLSYFDNRLREAAETKPAEKTAQTAYKPEEVFTEELWTRAIEGYKRTKHWSYGKWSLPPDMPGCSIPQHILAAHGYSRAAA
jgi:hypothetical protein